MSLGLLIFSLVISYKYTDNELFLRRCQTIGWYFQTQIESVQAVYAFSTLVKTFSFLFKEINSSGGFLDRNTKGLDLYAK